MKDVKDVKINKLTAVRENGHRKLIALQTYQPLEAVCTVAGY